MCEGWGLDTTTAPSCIRNVRTGDVRAPETVHRVRTLEGAALGAGLGILAGLFSRELA
jgi:hypothetical protein